MKDPLSVDTMESRESMEDDDDEEVDPPPRALVSAQMEYLIASAAVGERASEFDQLTPADLEQGCLSWQVDGDLKLRPTEATIVPGSLLFLQDASESCFVILEKVDRKTYRGYHWIGQKAHLNAVTTTAFKAVELSRMLREKIGAAKVTCHRELQGDESDEFRALAASFANEDEEPPPSMVVPPNNGGGHTAPATAEELEPRLLVVVRRFAEPGFARGARLADVAPVAATILSPDASRFVLLLDSGGKDIFQWHGALTTLRDRAAGLETALLLRRERAEAIGRCDPVRVIHQGNEPDDFWTFLSKEEELDVQEEEPQKEKHKARKLHKKKIRTPSSSDSSHAYDSDEDDEELYAKMSMRDYVLGGKADGASMDGQRRSAAAVLDAVMEELLSDAVTEISDVATQFDFDKPRGAPRLPPKPWYRKVMSTSGGGKKKKRSSVAEWLLKVKIPPKSRSHYALGGAVSSLTAPLKASALAWTKTVNPRLVIVRWRSGDLDAIEEPCAALEIDGQKSLQSRSCCVVDAGGAVFIWRGRNSGGACRGAAGHVARELMSRKPSWCKIYDLHEGYEPIAFRSQFEDWTDAELQRARALNQNSFDRHYERRRASSSATDFTGSTAPKSPPGNRKGGFLRQSKRSPPPQAWREALASGEPQSPRGGSRTHLLARQRDVFAAVASMLRQSWGSSAAAAAAAKAAGVATDDDDGLTRSDSHASFSGDQPKPRRPTRRSRRREYLCGDPAISDDEDDEEDPLERKSRENRTHIALEAGGDHHVVVWRLEGGRLNRLDESDHGHFDASASYAVLYGATVDVAAHDAAAAVNEALYDEDLFDEDDDDAFFNDDDDDDGRVKRKQFQAVEEDDDGFGAAVAPLSEESSDAEGDLDLCDEGLDDESRRRGAVLLSRKKSLRPTKMKKKPDSRFVLTFWQGERAPREDRSRWLLELRPWILDDWADELRGGPGGRNGEVAPPTEHLRVVQRREARLFLHIAHKAMGGYVVHLASRPQACHLFHVRGDALAFAVEVAPYASSLSSADVFIAAKRGDLEDEGGDPARMVRFHLFFFHSERNKKTQVDDDDADSHWSFWVWVGAGSNTRCRRVTAGLVLKIMDYFGVNDEQTKVRVLDESGDDGSEARLDFWRALGGPRPYADHPLLRVPPGNRSSVARAPLFFVVRSDDDNKDCAALHAMVDQHRLLKEDRAIVVDAHYAVMVWLGKKTKRRDTALAKQVAFAYAAATRSPPCRVRVVRQSFECSHFKCLFHGWDSGLHKSTIRMSFDLHGGVVERPSLLGLSGEARLSFSSPQSDPRATYLIRKKTERSLLEAAERENEPRDSLTNHRPSPPRKQRDDSVFAALLTALLPPPVKPPPVQSETLPTHADIQLGRVLDTDPDDLDDGLHEDHFGGLSPKPRMKHLPTFADGLGLDDEDDAEVDDDDDDDIEETDPIILGADAAREANRKRRKSCSF